MDKRILHFTAQTFRPVPSHLLHPPSLLYYSSTPRPLHFLDNTVERDAMVELRSEISSIIRQIAQEYIQQYPVPSTSFTVQTSTSTSTSTSGKKVNTSGMYVTTQFILYFILFFPSFILFLSFYLSFYLFFTYFFLHINIITSFFLYLFIYFLTLRFIYQLISL